MYYVQYVASCDKDLAYPAFPYIVDFFVHLKQKEH